MPDSEQRQRRATDISAAVRLYVDQEVTDVRHLLRGEFGSALTGLEAQFANLQAALASSALQSTKEHAIVTAAVDAVRADVAVLKPLAEKAAEKIAGLERTDAAEQAADALREKMIDRMDASRRWTIGFGATVVALLLTLLGLVVDRL